jgi:hypothetical protein
MELDGNEGIGFLKKKKIVKLWTVYIEGFPDAIIDENYFLSLETVSFVS